MGSLRAPCALSGLASCPPAGLRLDLGPEATIEPRVGECVLFPSTLYHGTRQFPAGKRMSVAIDVNLAHRE